LWLDHRDISLFNVTIYRRVPVVSSVMRNTVRYSVYEVSLSERRRHSCGTSVAE